MVGLWLLGGAAPGWAMLQFDVFTGYGPGVGEGVVRESAWFPVVFEVFNDGPSFHGVVELVQQSGQTRTLALELPTNTRKRFTIPAYCSSQFPLPLEARLRDERGRVRAESLNLRPRLVADWRSPLVGGLPRSRGGLPVLAEPAKKEGRFQPFCALLQPELLPDHPMALEGLQALYLHSARAPELKAPQATALLAWLHEGGHLIVAVEQPGDLNGAPWLKSLLPCELAGLTNSTQPALLQEWLLSSLEGFPRTITTSGPLETQRLRSGRVKSTTSTVTVPVSNPYLALEGDPGFAAQPMQVAGATLRDGQVTVGSSAQPLVVSAKRGRGQVTVLTFSPELEPFRSWKNRSWFWTRLLSVPPEWLATGSMPSLGGRAIDGVFGAMIDSRQIRKLPVPWLLALLVAYLVVIGPLDYFWLKKINRQMLTWLTFPAYVALFSGLIYVIGYKLRAGETEWNEFHLVDVMPHGERADLRGRAYGSIYSPVNADYPVASDQTFATLRGEQGRHGGAEVSRARLEQRGNNFTARLSVPVWTSQLYEYEWWRQDQAPLQVSLSPRAAGWELRVQNPARRAVSRAWLVVEGRWFELGDLSRGKTNLLDRSQGQPLLSFVQNQVQVLAQAVEARQSQWGSGQRGHLDDLFSSACAASFIGLAAPAGQRSDYYSSFGTPAYFDLTSQLDRGDAVLLAYLNDQTLVPPLNQFTPRYSKRNTLLRIVLSTDPSRGSTASTNPNSRP